MSIDPDAKWAALAEDTHLSYDFLVVATGLKLNVYQYDQIDSTSRMIEEFHGALPFSSYHLFRSTASAHLKRSCTYST
jgi:NADH dehydrogenase FAD-containing subunit